MKYLAQILVACAIVIATWYVTRELERPQLVISVVNFSATQPQSARVRAKGIDYISEFFSDEITTQAREDLDSYIEVGVPILEEALAAASAKQESFKDAVTRIVGFDAKAKNELACENFYSELDNDFAIDIYVHTPNDLRKIMENDLLEEGDKERLVEQSGIKRDLTWCQALSDAERQFRIALNVNNQGINLLEQDLQAERSRLRKSGYGLIEVSIQNFGGRNEIVRENALLVIEESSKTYRLKLLAEASYLVIPPDGHIVAKYRTKMDRSDSGFADIERLFTGEPVFGNIRIIGSEDTVWISDRVNFSFAESREESEYARLSSE